ncbi:TetR/AcrR family transcriptional regulator [Jongsikchunia kroppenstedtii]|uniref:TetR/AcrR family transcriptional regulator n=1 Tax=Jongsikchunia kroppenstedtii TaxID=1121721 RepID=UPI00036678DE|nr:helix-turn-helix domain-containing protein [Jongsikchunia kroppenstedtii]
MADSAHARKLLSLLSAQDADDPERDRILAIAREEILAYGYERFGTDRLAREAKVSRQTVYRRCGRKVDIFDALVRAEFRDTASQWLPAFDIADPAERFVQAWVAAIATLHGSELLRSLIQHDPGFVSQMWASLDSSTVDLVRGVWASTIPTPDGLVISEVMVRIVVSLYTEPTPLIPLDDRDQIESFVRRYIAPVLEFSLAAAALH